MKKNIFLSVALIFSIFACKKSENSTDEETYVKGKADIYVDESLLPIVEDQELIFENRYPKAVIKLIPKSDSDIVNLLIQKKIDIAVLSHELTTTQEKTLKDSDFVGKNTPFCSDAIALIVNSNQALSSISTTEVYNVLKGNASTMQYVFDNENSSTLSFLMDKAGVTTLPKNITALKNNSEVIEFVSKNTNSIGFVGVNWLLNPSIETENTLKKVKVLSVGTSPNNAVKPSQTNIETKTYPFVRQIYLLNYQGRVGLGMGFASFIKSEVGQRIILKSGLTPVKIPTREIRIIKNNKKN